MSEKKLEIITSNDFKINKYELNENSILIAKYFFCMR